MTAAPEPVGPVAIVVDATDAALFLSARPATRALALTPEARGILIEGGVAPATSREYFSDYDHARALAVVRRVEHAVDQALGRSGLEGAAGEFVRDAVLATAAVSARAWRTLSRFAPPDQAWTLWDAGEWRELGGTAAAHTALVRRLWLSGHPDAPSRPPAFPGLYRMLRALAARSLRLFDPWILSARRKLPFDLDRCLDSRAVPVRRCYFETADGSREYGRLVREVWLVAARGKKVARLAALGARDDGVRQAVRQLVSTLPEHPATRPIKTLGDSIGRSAEYISTGTKDAEAVVRRLAPRAFIQYQCSGLIARLTADAAGNIGLDRLILNYNSHTPSRGARTAFANHHHYRLKVVNDLSDEFLCWSPHAAAVTRDILGPRDPRPIRPVRTISVPSEEPLPRHRPTVLHAGSFLGWPQTLLWILETSDEYADSIAELADAFRDLPDADLILRAKEKSECGPDALRRLIPPSDNVTITDTSEPYRQVLRKSDLLVSFMSTTIEEAVLFRRPVLLWGPTARYLHLPARTTPPRAGDRVAVYAAMDKAALRPMITAILDAHAGKPLTDAEIAEHAWPDSVPDTAALAHAIAGGDHAAAWRTAVPSHEERAVLTS